MIHLFVFWVCLLRLAYSGVVAPLEHNTVINRPTKDALLCTKYSTVLIQFKGQSLCK